MPDATLPPQTFDVDRYPHARRKPLLLAAIVCGAVVVVLLGMLVFFVARADQRAERAGRTACTLAGAVGSLADGFNTTLQLVGGDTQAHAEAQMRGPITVAQAAARQAAIDQRCKPGA